MPPDQHFQGQVRIEVRAEVGSHQLRLRAQAILHAQEVAGIEVEEEAAAVEAEEEAQAVVEVNETQVQAGVEARAKARLEAEAEPEEEERHIQIQVHVARLATKAQLKTAPQAEADRHVTAPQASLIPPTHHPDPANLAEHPAPADLHARHEAQLAVP